MARRLESGLLFLKAGGGRLATRGVFVLDHLSCTAFVLILTELFHLSHHSLLSRKLCCALDTDTRQSLCLFLLLVCSCDLLELLFFFLNSLFLFSPRWLFVFLSPLVVCFPLPVGCLFSSSVVVCFRLSVVVCFPLTVFLSFFLAAPLLVFSPLACVFSAPLLFFFHPLFCFFSHTFVVVFPPLCWVCKQCTSHVTFFSCLCALVMLCHTTLAQVFVRVIPSMCHAPECLISLRPSLRTLHLSLPSST